MLSHRRLWRLPRLARRPRPAPLPDALRARLLAIPGTASRGAIVPRQPDGFAGGLEWLWATPLMPLAASFALAVTLAAAGNPYRIGAAVMDRLVDDARPAATKVGAGLTELAAKAADVGRDAAGLLPDASLRASRIVAAQLAERIYDDEPVEGASSGRASR